MSALADRPPISRILVELGASPDGNRVIAIACDLAAAVQAELHGLLVQDEALDDLSGLPFARTVLPGRVRPEALNPELLRVAYERQAANCRRTLSARASGSQVTWSLDTARGRGSAEFRARISRSDLVVFQQHSLGQSTRDLIGQARNAAVVASGVVLIGRRVGPENGPVIAIDDGDEAGAETIAFTARLARRLGANVEVFIIARDDGSAKRTEARAQALLKGVPVTAVRRFADRQDGALEDTLGRSAPRFVVADLEGAPFRDIETAVRVVRAAGAPIVLIKPRPAA